MIRVFDLNGKPLGEIKANYTCSWILNGPGKLSFMLSVNDAKCQEGLLQFGNLIFAVHDDLPAWGGVIDTPREWGSGLVKVNAWSGEKLLDYRRGPLGQKLTGTCGSIFTEIINYAKKDAYLPVAMGNVFWGGTSREETLNDRLLTEATRIVKRAGMEWYFEPAMIGDGRLIFLAHCMPIIGYTVGLDLAEGVQLKLSDRPLVEQGEIFNDVQGYGEGVTWAKRPTAVKSNSASIGIYGLRQGLTQFGGVTQVGTVEANTASYLTNMAWPRVSLDVNVANVNGVWKQMRLGNQFNVRLNSVGFTGGQFGMVREARALGMEYDGLTLRLICEA